MASISPDVSAGEMGKRVLGCSTLLNHPAAELLDGLQVEVAGLDAEATLLSFSDIRLDARRTDAPKPPPGALPLDPDFFPSTKAKERNLNRESLTSELVP